MYRSYMYICINLPYFHFKHDVLITEKPLWGVFNKVLSYLIYLVTASQPFRHCVTQLDTSRVMTSFHTGLLKLHVELRRR